MIFVGISLILVGFIMSIDWKFWRTFAYVFYGAGLLGLLLVLIIGKEINGAKAWFMIGGFGIQPAELAKLGTCLSLSNMMSSPNIDFRETRTQMAIGGLLLIPMFLIMLQPDAGSCLVFLSFSIMLYREGLSPLPYVVAFGLASVFIMGLKYDPHLVFFCLMMLTSTLYVVFIAEQRLLWITSMIGLVSVALYAFFSGRQEIGILIMLLITLVFVIVHSRRGRFKLVVFASSALFIGGVILYGSNFAFYNVLRKHQQERLNVWLNPDKVDPRGAAYNSIHSKMAIGSGGLAGKGFLEGTMTRLNYVPEQSTDFIFCTVGEEHGFIGTAAVIGFFLLFLIRIVQIAERQRSNFSRCYAYGIAGIFFVHFLINVGMTMGLMPIIGIPLPFVSAGGSSLLGFTGMFAILLKLDSHRYSV
jgi:rod shape determining protein RodA